MSVSVYRAERQDKPWGHEISFAAVEGRYVGNLLHVTAGQALSRQYHQNKEETISLVQGTAYVEYGEDADRLTGVTFEPGDTIHLPAGTVHRIRAVTDIVCVECSTAASGWREDVVRLDDAYGRAGTSEP